VHESGVLWFGDHDGLFTPLDLRQRREQSTQLETSFR
jgi:hypothetical protein